MMAAMPLVSPSVRRGRRSSRPSVTPLEEREQRVVQRLAQARALPLGAIGADLRRDGDERSGQARREVEGEVAGEDEEHQHVERQLDAIRRGDDHHVTVGVPREERDGDGDRGEYQRPEREPHG